MPFYDFQCCKCGKVQEVKRSMTDTSLVACSCGYTCRKMITADFAIGSNGEIDQYDNVRKAQPKYLRFKDGHREKFDPSKHGHRKGGESHLRKEKPKKPSKTSS